MIKQINNIADVKQFIDERIEESTRFLDDNNATYEDILKNSDTNEYSEESDNNNFEASIISGLLELKKLLFQNN